MRFLSFLETQTNEIIFIGKAKRKCQIIELLYRNIQEYIPK